MSTSTLPTKSLPVLTPGLKVASFPAVVLRTTQLGHDGPSWACYGCGRTMQIHNLDGTGEQHAARYIDPGCVDATAHVACADSLNHPWVRPATTTSTLTRRQAANAAFTAAADAYREADYAVAGTATCVPEYAARLATLTAARTAYYAATDAFNDACDAHAVGGE